MRMKFIRNGKTQRRELVVASQRGELLDVKRASKLAEDLSTLLLLGYSYETQRGGSASLQHYDVEGLWSLRTYLTKRAMSVEELMGLLQATQQVLEVCQEKRLPTDGLLFDPEYVFVDTSCRPHFALVLLDGVPFQARNSPLTLLRAIGGGEHLRFASPDAEDLSRRVGQFVDDQNGVYSANTYRRLLEAEERAQGMVDTARGVAEQGGGSVWASAGGASGTEAKDGGSFFWSPLAGLVDQPAKETSPQGSAAQVSAAPPTAPLPAKPASAAIPVAPAAVAPTPAKSAPGPTHVAPGASNPEKPASAPAPMVTASPLSATAPTSAPASPEPTASAPVASAASPACAPASQTAAASGPAAMPAATPGVAVAPAAAAQDLLDVPDPLVGKIAATPAPPASQPQAWLVRPRTGEAFALPLGQQVRVGRGSACDIRLLGNRTLSRVHAGLTFTGQTVLVSDLGAANGIFIDGERLGAQRSVLMTAGQSLRLADEELELRVG